MSTEEFPEKTILIIDDNQDFLNSIDTQLRSNGFTNIELCPDSRNVMEKLSSKEYSLVLLDERMPYISGDELLPSITKTFPDIPVLLITSYPGHLMVTSSACGGAFDYLTKESGNSTRIKKILQTLDLMDVKREKKFHQIMLSAGLDNKEYFEDIITRNSQMIQIFKDMETAACSCTPLIISGEPGTGKKLLAQAFHQASRRSGTLVNSAINGKTPYQFFKDLIRGENESKILEQAREGTLLIDFSNVSVESQEYILRILNGNEIEPGIRFPTNIQVVITTQKDAPTKFRAGEFTIDPNESTPFCVIKVPPLRKRKEDIPLLVDHFLEMFSKKHGKRKPFVTNEFLFQLYSYHFPGNVKELEILIENIVVCRRFRAIYAKVFHEITKIQKLET